MAAQGGNALRLLCSGVSTAWASLSPNQALFCLGQVKKALCVLIQHNLVTYQLQKRGFVEYEAQCKRVLRILRYPRYIYTAKTLYNDMGELIVEELLLNGKMTMSAVVRKVADRLTETMEGEKLLSLKKKGIQEQEEVQRLPEAGFAR